MQQSSVHGMWSSRLTFILAAAGSAVGLGNIWRFPYLTSDNGGGAFVLVYLACILLCGLPVLIAEILIGRHGRHSPVNTFESIAKETGSSRAWSGIGWMGMLAGVLILSFYSVVAGWTLHYTWLYVQEVFGGEGITDAGATFNALLGNAGELTFWHAIFMVMTLVVVGLGVEKGLERAVKFLMPALLVMLLVLVGYGATTGHLGEAAAFLFTPDFSKIDGGVFLSAMGQAFFSLSLGMCTMMTYGAYLPRNISIPRVSVSVALTDTGVALLAGLAIFPIVIQYLGTPTGGGPGLIFASLPAAFAQMGAIFGLIFFALLAIAAWTSSISLLEPATAFLVERTPFSRKVCAAGVAVLTWIVGLASVLSLNHWSEVRIAGFAIMDFIELLANDFMLPLGGLLTAIFAGWVLSHRIVREEFEDVPDIVFKGWTVLVRYISPILVGVVLVRGVMDKLGA
ncbi:sodium-dependent transporter [Pseudomarimonas salicorniae]|uniref:Transporter n=1 Tax=Pseudomarimonas salicorniae TaxID=2933270 RepID=A0ABT0GLJ6_9GAMM|nr:sodium-dependent transporter [Lysobacter sp. CAU 1642]MCK7595416.1 sodium-dependent transporter [Lysobacter sp. CAU 1642]